MLDCSESESLIQHLSGNLVKDKLGSLGIDSYLLNKTLHTSSKAWRKVVSDEGLYLRSSCWYVKSPCTCAYDYGHTKRHAHEAPQWMLDLGAALADIAGVSSTEWQPNSCNCNLYSGSASSLGWHSDNEHLFIGADGTATILSISFGMPRVFEHRKKNTREKPRWVTLADFDLLTMQKKCSYSGNTGCHSWNRVTL